MRRPAALGSTLCAALVVVAAGACAATPPGAAPAATMTSEQLAARGRAVAETYFPGLASLCDLDMVFQNVNVPRASMAERERTGAGAERRRRGDGTGARAELGPMQVFDDLYFLGNREVAAWLIGSNADGFVLIDALTSDAAADQHVIGGMRALGLDPGKVRMFVVSHAHGDHYGGHRLLSRTLGLPVSMSREDWGLARTLNGFGEHPRFGPAPDSGETISDGQVVRLGKTEIRFYVGAAHTPGTISPIVTVHDKGVPHKLILWGGTGLNFGPNEAGLRAYAATAARFRTLATGQGVDIFLSNHPARDGAADKMQQLAQREPGAPHPFVMGSDALKVFDVLEYCPRAQAQRIASGQYQPGGGD